MGFGRANDQRGLKQERVTGQKIDGACVPGLVGKCRLADREDIVGAMQRTPLVGQPNTGVGD